MAAVEPLKPRAGTRGQLRLGHILGAGLVDSSGLAFGWTVVLLVVTVERGLGPAALLTSATLVGMALSAPFSSWVSSRLSAQRLLQWLAVSEGLCRASLFTLMVLDVATWSMALLAALTNMIAWSAYAAMRAEASRVSASRPGSSLTWYAVTIASAEAVAAGAASLLIRHPPTWLLVLVGTVYTLSLFPQWWVGTHADLNPPSRGRARVKLHPVLAPSLIGALVFFLAAGPALLASVLAYERYGSAGVVVTALAFTLGSLGSARLQGIIGRVRPLSLAACLLGAAMVGCWAVSSLGLAALAIAQVCVGLTQCCLEGDLDSRTFALLGDDHSAAVAGLAFASSSRAIGGAVAVAVLPAVIHQVPLPMAAAGASGLLLTTAAAILVWNWLREDSLPIGEVNGRGTYLGSGRVPLPRAEAAAAETGSWRHP